MHINRLLVSLFFSFIFFLQGMGEEISFNHLTTEDGLSNNSVMSMYQDERGFIWIGTRNGVNLYNGRDFKIYQYDKDNSNSLHYNHVTRIVGDKKGTVFFMTSKGVSAFDIRKETFTTLIYENVLGIYYNEALYISMKNSIYRYNDKGFELYFSLPDKDALINHIYLQNDSILMGTMNKGIFIVSKNDKITHLIPHVWVCDLMKDSSGRYWFPTWEHGLYMLQGGMLKNFRSKEDDPSSISSDFVYKCCEDKKGNIWVGTFNGLNLFHNETETFTSYTKSDKRTALSYPSIWSLLCDEQGTIWAGTYYGGINYFNPNNQIYTKYSTSLTESEGLSSQVVGQIVEDKDHHLWICTEGGGLNKFDRTTNTFTWYKSAKAANSLSHNNVKSLFYDRYRNVLWIGTHLGGLNKLNIATGHFTHYLSDSNDSKSLPSNVIRAIIPYQNKLVLATNRGIFMFDPETTKGEMILYDLGLHSAIELKIDSRGVLWITGSDELEGIFAYNFSTKKLKRYISSSKVNSISSTVINQIFEDSRKRLWFCTNENGLDLYNPLTDSFENFDKQKNNFASNIIYNICELSQNELLLTTDHGFSIFDLKEKRSENYGKENGLPMIGIKERSLCKTSDGEIFIGGVDGMFSFKPECLKPVFYSYSILPYQLFIDGEKVIVGDQDGVLSQSLSLTKRIILKSHQNRIDVEYAFTDYLPSYRRDIVYFLEGFSKSWTSMRGKNTVTYANLTPGKYVLVVRAEGADGSLVPESRLEIEILPPYYRTIWAYLIYFFCLAILSFYLVRMYKKRIELQESLKYEKKHTEDIEKLNQAKLRFFTDISHEFRTPLTLIIGQMEMLLQTRSLVPGGFNKILGVYKSCLHLRELLTELLDFRKQDQGYLKIKVVESNIVSFLHEHYLLFNEYALQRHVNFQFSKGTDDLEVWFDPKQIHKVFNNLISNAFKYTKEGEGIKISIRKEHEEAVIEIIDTGVGIAPKDMDRIFNRFYQVDQDSSFQGTGIGLALSKSIIDLHHGRMEVRSEGLGMGTAFCIYLKMGNNHFQKEQLGEKGENVDYIKQISMSESFQSILLQEDAVSSENNNVEEVSTGGVKILIIEDNPSLRNMLIQIFRPFYMVLSSSNGLEGLEMLRSEMPDIVLSDIVMPGMSGIELCQIVKKDLDTCHIPVILLTAKTTVENNLEGLRTGADDYITKPFNINILLSRCNNLVNNRILLQEKFSKQPQIMPQMLATNALDKDFIDRAVAVVEQHLDDFEFSMDSFASELGMARTKLFTKMKAVAGQTPYEFIMTYRLKQAATMLRSCQELSISEISDRLGFSSPKYFTKCFKDRYHIAPQNYRKDD